MKIENVEVCLPIMAYSVNQVCISLGLSRTAVYDLIGSGKLPTLKIGKRRLIRPEALERYIASLETNVPEGRANRGDFKSVATRVNA